MIDHDLALTLSKAVDTVRAGIREPVWTPLEALLPMDWCDGFMFMGGTADCRIFESDGIRPEPTRRAVFAYKHGITRRYLHIDSNLGTCFYRGDLIDPDDHKRPVYQRLGVEAAIEAVYEDIEQFRADHTTKYDADYIAERNRRLIEAGYSVIG